MGQAKAGVGVWSLTAYLFFFLLGAAVRTSGGPTPRLAAQLAGAFFAFGDSYADTGNRDRNASSWNQPYGITWPGRPFGRFSNGHIQTDYLADVVGLPSPTPYVLSDHQSIKTGINFAIGGSGVTFAYGLPPLGTQVNYFELVLREGVYSTSTLASAVTLVSNVGNDFNAGLNYTDQELVDVIGEVVEGIILSLRRLYELGLRNILVANLPPISCVPSTTIALNYTACVPAYDPLIDLHNNLLQEGVAELNKLPGANYIVLDQRLAFLEILNNSARYGITEKLAPCCRPTTPEYYCGSVDLQGNKLYTVCDDPASHMFWDSVHPTQTTWQTVVSLYKTRPGFVIGAHTLELWLEQNSLRPVLPPAPAPSVPILPQGAAGQLEMAYEALIPEGNYSEALGLLQAVKPDEYLAQDPDLIVTVFLPHNEAFVGLPTTIVSEIYGHDQVLSVISFHVVQGYYDSSQLSSLNDNLTTVSALPLLVKASPTEILVGPQSGKVVRPNLYNVAGQVVVHGIDKLLLPPSLA